MTETHTHTAKHPQELLLILILIFLFQLTRKSYFEAFAFISSSFASSLRNGTLCIPPTQPFIIGTDYCRLTIIQRVKSTISRCFSVRFSSRSLKMYRVKLMYFFCCCLNNVYIHLLDTMEREAEIESHRCAFDVNRN